MNDLSASEPTAADVLSDADRAHLVRCVDLAGQALEAGHSPFGSILVDADGNERFADHNRCGDGDRTRHPEFAATRWAAQHLTEQERARATVYTSGEHCAMCAAAHGWVGLGRIVFAVSSAQLAEWYLEWGVPSAPVATLSVIDVVPGAVVAGPDEGLVPRVKALHALHTGRGSEVSKF